MLLARLLTALLAATALTTALYADETLIFDQPQTAGISGLRPFWDRPVVLAAEGLTATGQRGNILKAPEAVWAADLRWHNGLNYWIPEKATPEKLAQPGALAFDAVHRSLLVRFPGAAAAITQKLLDGRAIAKVELLLPFKDTEKISLGYKEPTSFIGDMWDVNVPRWHAQAWALRQPWQADAQLGPTFNASVNGVRYWTHYGATDEQHDRYPTAFGPAEVSVKTTAPLDLTASLTDAAYGKDFGERLRRLEDCGYLVRKWETYDAHFITPGYEWAIHTGPRAILIGTPQLRVTFVLVKPAKLEPLPPATDFAALAKTPAGAATAKLPTAAEFAALHQRFAFSNRRPAGMPDWQWQRLNELYTAGGHANTFPDTLEEYQRWLDSILATAPRSWEGFAAGDQLMLYYDYQDALPAYVGDHWRRYWTAQLMPDRDYWQLTHNQYHQIRTKYRGFGSSYTDQTDDWHGNKSFYRESYCRYMSTMNFNHTAALGALLGGAFIGADKAVLDGRYGLEMFPLRLWAWYDGTQQEGIDHYYFSITMTDQKTFADYAPTPFDRLMGHSALAKSMEDLLTCYHPTLRRFVSTGLRTAPYYATQTQDGVQHIIDTLSPSGADTDLDIIDAREKDVRAKVLNHPPILGHDLPPRRVAMQTLKSPWAPLWTSELVDRKDLPFQVISTWRQWGAYRTEPKWKVAYMGQHYGVASFDFNSSPTINLQAIWARTPGRISSGTELGQLLCRFGYNRTNFIDTYKGGTLGNMGGALAVLQHHGKLLIASSPLAMLKAEHFNPAKDDIRSVQTSIALFTAQEQPTWQIFVDGQPVSVTKEQPVTAKAGARIVVQDGVSFVGIIPLAATDLGRDAEVVLKLGGEPVQTQTGDFQRESLLVESYFYKKDQKLDLAAQSAALDAAHGGFVVEVADTSEYADLAAFQQHLKDVVITQKDDAATGVVALSCQSGKDLLEMGFKPIGADSGDNAQLPSVAIPYRRVNGQWPYLPEGIERDTPVSVLGRKGVLAKNGATLTLERDQMGYLLTEPHSGTVMAANPLPDATQFSVVTKDDVSLTANGKVGLGFFTWESAAQRLTVDYALRPGQDTAGMATCLLLRGPLKAPAVVLNGAPLKAALRSLPLKAGLVWLVPLVEGADLSGVTEATLAGTAATPAAPAAGTAAIATLVYDKGEHYLLTKPSASAWSFQRQWPSPIDFRATTPAGLSVAADGLLPFLQLLLDPAHARVELFAPQYLYDADSDSQRFDEKATALLLFNAGDHPTVIVNGQPVTAPLTTVELDGAKALVVPLFGKDAAAVTPGLAERYRTAMGHLPK